MLNVIDEFTHECLAIRVARRLKAIDVIDVLSDLFILRGAPGHIRSDNGPEFVASKRTRPDHQLDLACTLHGCLCLSIASIITLMPNIGLSWDSIQSDPLRHRRGRWRSTSCCRPRLGPYRSRRSTKPATTRPMRVLQTALVRDQWITSVPTV